MSEFIYTAGTGAIAQEHRLALLTNNLANVNSAGYKADRPMFKAYLPGDEDREDSTDPEDADPDAPVNTQFAVVFDGSRTDFTSGPLQNTGNPLDLAVVGEGFFSIQTPEGTQYTRNGQFSLNVDGVLVTQDGYPVLGEGGEINIEGADVQIASDGSVSVDGQVVDKLSLAAFESTDELRKNKGTRFKAPDGVTPTTGDDTITVRQGTIEQSNVNAVQMMTEMVEVLRAYEGYQRSMRSSDDSTSKLINEVGRPV